jgi:ATP-dependent helicase HrpB
MAREPESRAIGRPVSAAESPIDTREAGRASLPIDEVLPELRARLSQQGVAVLIAPPGAGKTTRAPLRLLDEPWAKTGKLILLEPRRLAARAAAARMAQELGEEIGGTIGLRVRLDTRVSARTRVEIVTDGVFSRMIVDDPALDGVAGVLFDEFHERSLDADVGLALARETRSALRPDLRLLIMSATLDGARVASFLDAPVVESRGRAYPVETIYLGRDPQMRLEEDMARAAVRALRSQPGSALAFLPGRAEIERTRRLLVGQLAPDVIVAPLHGSLDRAAQDAAIRPPEPGCRKIVLATSLAETSLTIEGVRIVIDSGLARAPRFEAALGLSRLETIRAPRASVDQRRGRAGRVEPGVCYRLWDEAATASLPAFATPEILASDLAGLILDLAAWGVRDPLSLGWLDAPPAPALAEGRNLLRRLQAIDAEGGLTDLGRAMRRLPMPPRLARMAVDAAREGQAALGAELAAVLTERIGAPEPVDLRERVARLRSDRSAQGARRLARTWARALGGGGEDASLDAAGRLTALAFPDRVAKGRDRRGVFLMANGRAAELDPADPLASEPWIVAADLAGRAEAPRILAAVALSATEARDAAGDGLSAEDSLLYDERTGKVRRRVVERLGAIVLQESIRPARGEEAAAVLARRATEAGRLPWTETIERWRARVAFMRRVEGEPWPDLSDERLRRDPEIWLAPTLALRDPVDEVRGADLQAALHALLDWSLMRRLDSEAPEVFPAPTGSSIAIDYAAEGGPAVEVRVQELYGLTVHPRVASGRVPLLLRLLSPARRPIQVTRDLPGFWKGSWAEVASEMRGRYPKHLWPADPASAAPTVRAKPRP